MTAPARESSLLRGPAVWFLALQGTGALAWWAVLILVPDTRRPFLAPDASDTTLLAFLLPDVTLFAGGSLASAWGLARRRMWAWPVLCAHAGAAVYAALYCLALPLLSGGGWLGAAMMLPSLVVPPFLAWRLRPGI